MATQPPKPNGVGVATPATDTLTWLPARREELPCVNNPTDLWFSEYPEQIEQAKQLCQQCPVREACLAGALDRKEYAGVWGGELFANGVILAYKRARGRPRKNAA